MPASSLLSKTKQMSLDSSRIEEYKFGSTLKTYTLLKRNGMIVPFRSERIATAIEGAFRDTKDIAKNEPLPKLTHQDVQNVNEKVVKEALSKADLGETLTVEGIQDIVETKLMECGFHDVARNYIVYRDQHKLQREHQTRALRVLRHDKKTLVKFNPMKISSEIEAAFREVLDLQESFPEAVISTINIMTNNVIQELTLKSTGKPIDSEEIQNSIERVLMRAHHYDVAKHLILKRAVKNVKTDTAAPASIEASPSILKENPVLKKQTTFQDFSVENYLKETITYACQGYEKTTSSEELIESALLQCHKGIEHKEVYKAAIMAAKQKIENEPNYSNVAAKILLDQIYRETLDIKALDKDLTEVHANYFKTYMKSSLEHDSRLDKRLNNFDLEKLSKALDTTRDLKFSYLAMQTLYDRYFIHKDQKRLETPQVFWMRVAMGLAINEGAKKNDFAIEFYNVLSQFLFVSSTPTLFNAGTKHPQLSSCYLATVGDDLHQIFKLITDNAQLSKWAGGIGNDWTPVRATGSLIKGTNGFSQGVIPFLKVVNDTAVAVNQGGKRKGATCTYLETWHLDIEDFLELRKNTGDDRRRTHDMNTANWIPDLFMKRVKNQEKWTLFSPIDTPELHDLYGKAFEKKYVAYENAAQKGMIKNFKQVEALILWRKMLSMLFETGHPWITFKDPSNIRSPQDHRGTVHSSNLCTEILLNTSLDETAVCNLGSVNIAAHTKPDRIDQQLLSKTIRTAMRMLDNVIDINFYPTVEARTSNIRHRPVGLGMMGFQDALHIQEISYASPEAIDFADKSMEIISYFAILASSELAKEKAPYSTFKGSKWDKGILPIDSLKLLIEQRGEDIEVDTSSTLDWDELRKHISLHGMRNSNTMAIAPTATIANIADITSSIEPTYKQLFVKSNLSGEFTVVNPYLVKKLKELNLWDEDMVDDLKYFDGSLIEMSRIPEEIKKLFPTAFEIEPEWIIECASRRQKWIDMGQSLNLYINQPSGKKLHNMYMLAWHKGLKTTYYLRTLGATQIEKSSSDINKRSIQPRWMQNSSASGEIEVKREKPSNPTVCNLEEGCESCQ